MNLLGAYDNPNDNSCKTFSYFKRSFPFVSIMNTNLTVATLQVQLKENLAPDSTSNISSIPLFIDCPTVHADPVITIFWN